MPSSPLEEVALLQQILQQLEQVGSIPLADWQKLGMQAENFGLGLQDNRLVRITALDRLNLNQIERALPDVDVRFSEVVDSTNNLLRQASWVGQSCIWLTEIQLAGRGRRGKRWLSPYARNLAISVGTTSHRKLSALGGLSLVVGLAICETLDTFGVSSAQVKWPNDIYVGDRKLCGILVELESPANDIGDDCGASGTRLIIGFGLNVSLTDIEQSTIEQPVTDLRRLGVSVDRTQMTIRLVQTVFRFVREFEAVGFTPFVETFNAMHRYHQKKCQFVQGGELTDGVVVGVGDAGELLVNTSSGLCRLQGGEVSFRSSS